MPYLSREQIEHIAEGVIQDYKQAVVPQKHLCYRVDPTELGKWKVRHGIYYFGCEETR